jgi:hypothetical protein
MNYLNQSDTRQSGPNLLVLPGMQGVYKLDRIGMYPLLVRNDSVGAGLASQQEAGDGRWYDTGNSRNLFVGDNAGAAGHWTDQADRRGTHSDGQPGLSRAADTTYFYAGRSHVK